MKSEEKIKLLEKLCGGENLNECIFYETLEKCDAIKFDYHKYMKTSPINCDEELLRLSSADYDLCCALITMLLREDHFSEGSFVRRLHLGQVEPIIKRIIDFLLKDSCEHIRFFSEKALEALNGFYVYALVDPRNDEVFYIGKGTGNRIFSHEAESEKLPESEKNKLKTIHNIKKNGFSVKRIIIAWGLSENEAFAAEAALINLLNCLGKTKLSNEVSGHHIHEALTVEDFELMYGAVPLKKEEIKHGILVIKINKLYRKGMNEEELYDAVRGFWAVSLKSIKERNVQYVFGVYNGLIVAVYKPDEWHYTYEMIDIPQKELLKPEKYEKMKNRVYFICKDYKKLDDEGKFYLNKSICELKLNQSAQNPVTYLYPERK